MTLLAITQICLAGWRSIIIKLGLCILVFLALSHTAAATDAISAHSAPWKFTGSTAIDIEALPLETFIVGDQKQNFGALRFMGGLALTSTADKFGAFSGLAISEDGGHMLAISDTGEWFTAGIQRENGKLSGLSNPLMAPLRGHDGTILNKGHKWNADAEGLSWHQDRALISFERQKGKLRTADLKVKGFLAPAKILPESKLLNTIRGNQGIESITQPPQGSDLAGSLIAIGERVLNGGHHTGWILKGTQITRFLIRRRDDFDITAAEFLPNGNLLLLERRFSLVRGSAVRLRQIASTDLSMAKNKPGLVLDGLDLMTADLRHQIDNMEGLAIHKNAQGQTIILLISDDNFNFFQRTLLLEFALRPEGFGVTPPPRPNLNQPAQP